MKVTTGNVQRILESIAPDGLSVNELLAALGQKKAKKASVRKCLKKIAQRANCKKRDNRYFLVAGKPQKIPVVQARSPRRSRQGSPQGIFLFEDGKGFIRDLQNNELYPLSPKEQGALFHGDEVRFALSKGKKDARRIEILQVTDRKTKVLRGTVSFKKRALMFTPSSSHFPHQFLVKKASVGKTIPEGEVQLEITRYPGLKSSPEGRLLLRQSPQINEEEAILKILSDFSVATHFPPAVLDACEKFPQAVRLNKKEKRQDLRDLPFVTIDGEDARDFDDAIYGQREGQGYRIWISIADVADYVSKGSKIDKEAFSRSTSVYLPGRVYPMLPEALSNGVCSLREGVNRKTLTCEILLDEQGLPLEAKVYESMIKNVCRLTYNQVDHLFEKKELIVKPSLLFLKEKLLLYREIADKMGQQRRQRGSIDFSLPDCSFTYDENQKIIDISKSYQSEAMKLIEQFMLEANENVGQFCDKNYIPIIWRNHAPPLEEKIRSLKQLFWNCRIKIPSLETSRDYNQALLNIKSSAYRDVLEYSLLRTMSQARYETERLGHFGLAATHYCHFTSPIRRYPDLIVHRALKAHLHEKSVSLVPESIAEQNSQKERLAVKAERKALKLKKLLFIAERIGDVFSVKISGLHWKGIFAEIDHPYVEGFIPFKSLTDDHYIFDENNQWVMGKRQKRQLMVGDECQVIMSRVDFANLSPEFEWISWTGEQKN
ncbi:MAG: hypothetical protein COB67_04065 [SAR324 cluster bacterium]|uniref:Ribonuclease R n=1 Tax=SAR324 cluster bacterium TaxID=2024889 RepID=A0A2A4T7D0_9DELT|nr:MAG: hypothetical protein COB67_04065 [SAR324 cluster bacterium]